MTSKVTLEILWIIDSIAVSCNDLTPFAPIDRLALGFFKLFPQFIDRSDWKLLP